MRTTLPILSLAFATGFSILAAANPEPAPVRLIQGTTGSDSTPWYKSNDPRQLWSRIEQLEAELVATRRQLAQAQELASENDKALRKAVADLARREQRIQRLESQLEGEGRSWFRRSPAPAAPPPPPTPISTADAAELQRLRQETAQLSAELERSAAAHAREVAEARAQLGESQRQIASLQSSLAELEAALRAAPPAQPADPEPVPVEVLPEPISAQPAEELPIPTPAPAIDEPLLPEETIPEDLPKPAPIADMQEAPSPSPTARAASAIARGNKQLQANMTADALKAFEEALEIDHSSLEARLGLAATHYSMGRRIQAGDILDEVLERDPEHPQALGLKGILVWKSGDPETAETILERAISLSPNDAQLYNYMAVVQESLSDIPQAIQALKNAVRIDPRHPDVHFNLAVLLINSDRSNLDEARAHYQKALELGSERNEVIEAALKDEGHS